MISAIKRLILCHRQGLIAISFLPGMLFRAAPALATQTHGGMEGLMSHQLGHLLFMLGMATLLVSILRRGLQGPGWAHFKIFLLLAISWNVLTFAGHWLQGQVASQRLTTADGRIYGFQITDISGALFYLSNLDHILLVPAFLFLLLALLQWRNAP